jgi:uncharacterized protein (DUF2141 family)
MSFNSIGYRFSFRNIFLTICILSLALILVRCANKTSPTGGPKDETPPVLMLATPPTGTINFDDQTIELEFDEYIKLDKAKEQILITPRMDGDYTIKNRRNRIIMEFDSAFAPNTTYTINFRESIVDITESNPAEQLKLAFSTGSYIDSLDVSGYVNHILLGTPAKKATVALYNVSDTFNILDGLPYYFTETNDSGMYVMENLKAGDYRVYAVMDENRNLMAETDKEPYGFLADTLFLRNDTTGIDIGLIQLDVSPFEIISARQTGTTFDVKVNKYIQMYSLNPLDSTKQLDHAYKDMTRETVSIFPTIDVDDSLAFVFTAYDSIRQEISDTLYLKFPDAGRRPSDFTMSVNIPNIPVNKPIMTANVTFNKPVKIVNQDSIFIQIDSAFTLSFDSSQVAWNTNRTSVTYSYLFPDSLFKKNKESSEPDKSKKRSNITPSLYLGNAAYISVESDTSKILLESLPFVQPTSLATLTFSINTNKEQYFIELLNSNNEVIETRPPAQTIEFKNIPPGDYSVRAVIDQNSNMLWDPGNILLNQLPENIVYYRGRDGARTINLRSNFDVQEDFEF